jgi:signal transduction histidine kinase
VAPVTVRAVDVPRRSRLPGRVAVLLALVPALVGLAVALVVAPSICPCHSPLVVLATASPYAALIALPVLGARAAPLASAVAIGLVTALGYAANHLLEDARVVSVDLAAVALATTAVTALVAALPACYLAGRHRREPVLVAVLAVLTGPTVGMLVFYAWLGDTPVFELIVGGGLMAIGYLAALAPAWASGLVRGRRARRDAERARRAVEQAERAVRDERARVMRELQGLVIADLAAIAEQAERADRVLAADAVDPGARSDARAALASMTATGRDTLTAMRRLLGMLRTTEPDGERAPQPTLDRLDELVEANRRAGLEVRVTVSGERRALPDDVDLAAYRLLQRVLAGCGSAVPVRLQVSYADRALRLVARGDVGDGCGIAVREWARMVGGEVAADVRSSTVEVWLPTGRGRAA